MEFILKIYIPATLQVQFSLYVDYSGTTIEKKGIHITSDVSISVVAINTANDQYYYSMDTFLVFLTATLGSTYLAQTGSPFLHIDYREEFGPAACQTIAVSLADNTVVTITQINGTNKQVTLKNEKNMDKRQLSQTH